METRKIIDYVVLTYDYRENYEYNFGKDFFSDDLLRINIDIDKINSQIQECKQLNALQKLRIKIFDKLVDCDFKRLFTTLEPIDQKRIDLIFHQMCDVKKLLSKSEIILDDYELEDVKSFKRKTESNISHHHVVLEKLLSKREAMQLEKLVLEQIREEIGTVNTVSYFTSRILYYQNKGYVLYGSFAVQEHDRIIQAMIKYED
jgi:hypothetical protein